MRRISFFKYIQFSFASFMANCRFDTKWALKRLWWDVYFAFTRKSIASEIEYCEGQMPDRPRPSLNIPPTVRQLEKATGKDALYWLMRFYYRKQKKLNGQNEKGYFHGNP